MTKRTKENEGDPSVSIVQADTKISASDRLGEMLVEHGIITENRLQDALQKQREEGGFLGQVLVELRYIDQQTLTLFLIKQKKIPHLNLLEYQIDQDALALVSRDVCQKFGVLPVDRMGNFLTLAMVDPLNSEALETVRNSLPDLKIKPILCDWNHFNTVFNTVFSVSNNEVEAKEIEAESFNLPPAPKQAKRQLKTKEAPKPVSPGEAISELPEGLAKTISEAIAAGFAATNTDRESQSLVTLEEKLVALTNTVSALVDTAGLVQSAREIESGLVAAEGLRDLAVPNSASTYDMGLGRKEAETKAGGDRIVLEALDTGTPIQGFAFDSFYPGSTNEFTFAVCKGVAEKPGKEYNPFFLCGPVGLGKTHLVNAIGNALEAGDRDRRVGYCSASRFADHVSRATRRGDLEGFRALFSRLDALILDDIQFLGGKIEAQEEFFHIFNALYQQGRQIVIAGDKPPEKLGLLEDRLISRFSGGIVSYLKPPDLAARLAILRSHAEMLGIRIPGDVLGLVAARIDTDVRKLTGCLQKIVAFGRLNSQDITCEMASNILDELGVVDAA